MTHELKKALKENNLGTVSTLLQNTDKTNRRIYQPQWDDLLGLATSKEMVDLLLAYGTSMRSSGGSSLLCKSISYENNNTALALYAIEKGADVNARCAGDPPRPLSRALYVGNEEVIRALLEKGVDESKEPYICETMMRFSSMRILIEAGFNPNVFDDNHRCPLFQAIESDHVEIAKYLIDNGADVNIVNRGQTPLIFAAGLNCLAIAQYLIQNGADLRRRGGSYNRTALEVALYSHNPRWRANNFIPMIQLLAAKDPESADPRVWARFRQQWGAISPEVIARARAPNAVNRRKLATIQFALRQRALLEARQRYTESQALFATAKTMLLSAEAKTRLDTIAYSDYTSIPQPPTVQNYVDSVLQAIDVETRKLNANTNVQYADRKHTRRAKEQEFKAQLESINTPNDASINTCMKYLELQIKDRTIRNQRGGSRKKIAKSRKPRNTRTARK